jgi:hypothetical protein
MEHNLKRGFNEHILSQIGHFTTKINPVLMNPGYHGQKWPVPVCLLKPSLTPYVMAYLCKMTKKYSFSTHSKVFQKTLQKGIKSISHY